MRKTMPEKLGAKIADGHRWNEQEARQVLETWDVSGESGAAFARRLGIDPQRLHWWQKRLGRQARERTKSIAARPAFVPVTIRAAGDYAVALRVDVGDGIRIEVNQVDAATAGWVAVFVSAVREARA